jgi:hypothetical protein
VIHSRNNGGGAGVMAAGDRPASPAILNGGTRDASSDHECGGALATAPFNESTLSLSLSWCMVLSRPVVALVGKGP